MAKYSLGKRHKPKDMTLPSGQTCQVRAEIKYSDMVRDGVIAEGGLAAEFPEYAPDTRATVDESKPVGEQIDLHMDELDTVALFEKLLSTPESFGRLWNLIDRIVAYTVLQPKVLIAPENPDEPRVAGAIYTDYILPDDRTFLFNYALGGADTADAFADELKGKSDG